jgi:hypothetical protein
LTNVFSFITITFSSLLINIPISMKHSFFLSARLIYLKGMEADEGADGTVPLTGLIPNQNAPIVQSTDGTLVQGGIPEPPGTWESISQGYQNLDQQLGDWLPSSPEGGLALAGALLIGGLAYAFKGRIFALLGREKKEKKGSRRSAINLFLNGDTEGRTHPIGDLQRDLNEMAQNEDLTDREIENFFLYNIEREEGTPLYDEVHALLPAVANGVTPRQRAIELSQNLRILVGRLRVELGAREGVAGVVGETRTYMSRIGSGVLQIAAPVTGFAVGYGLANMTGIPFDVTAGTIGSAIGRHLVRPRDERGSTAAISGSSIGAAALAETLSGVPLIGNLATTVSYGAAAAPTIMGTWDAFTIGNKELQEQRTKAETDILKQLDDLKAQENNNRMRGIQDELKRAKTKDEIDIIVAREIANREERDRLKEGKETLSKKQERARTELSSAENIGKKRKPAIENRIDNATEEREIDRILSEIRDEEDVKGDQKTAVNGIYSAEIQMLNIPVKDKDETRTNKSLHIRIINQRDNCIKNIENEERWKDPSRFDQLVDPYRRFVYTSLGIPDPEEDRQRTIDTANRQMESYEQQRVNTLPQPLQTALQAERGRVSSITDVTNIQDFVNAYERTVDAVLTAVGNILALTNISRNRQLAYITALASDLTQAKALLTAAQAESTLKARCIQEVMQYRPEIADQNGLRDHYAEQIRVSGDLADTSLQSIVQTFKDAFNQAETTALSPADQAKRDIGEYFNISLPWQTIAGSNQEQTVVIYQEQPIHIWIDDQGRVVVCIGGTKQENIVGSTWSDWAIIQPLLEQRLSSDTQ